MPSRVPHHLFIQRLVLQLRNNLLTYLRFLLVCFIWLGLVPFVARWIWRFYFRFGDWSASVSPQMNITEAPKVQGNDTLSGVLVEGFFGWLKGQDIWTAILRDCFQGQIITICLVAVFVVVFLIREWVLQNAVAVVEEPPARGAIPPVRPPQDPMEFWRLRPRALAGNPPERNAGEEPMAVWADMDTPDEVDGHGPQDLAPPIGPPQRAEPLVNVLDRRINDFDDDDLEGDDFDGLWDILGMQGPIIGLLHNTLFSALMIALAVGLGVWLPFMFGKTVLGALVHLYFGKVETGASTGCVGTASVYDRSIERGYMFGHSPILYWRHLVECAWHPASLPRHAQECHSKIIWLRPVYR